NIVMNPGSLLALSEDSADVGVSLRLAGDATIVGPSVVGTNISRLRRVIDITTDAPDTPRTLNWGRTDDLFFTNQIARSIGPNVTINLVNGGLYLLTNILGKADNGIDPTDPGVQFGTNVVINDLNPNYFDGVILDMGRRGSNG